MREKENTAKESQIEVVVKETFIVPRTRAREEIPDPGCSSSLVTYLEKIIFVEAGFES